MIDVLIIGAGCAGLTAAIYAARENKKVLVIEAESVGGQIASSPRVENYPGIREISGLEFADSLAEQAAGFGAELDFADAQKIIPENGGFTVLTGEGSLRAKSIIIASGAKPRPLGLPRETDLVGNGVSYCAICDGAFYAGKPVAVAGGGSSALQAALTLSGICESVTLIHRRAEYRAPAMLADRVARAANIHPLLGYEVCSLAGGTRLSGLVVSNLSTGEKIQVPADCLFVYVGQTPDNERFSDIVRLDGSGYIAAGEDCKTSCPGVFAAGDCRSKQIRQLATAAADGAVAGLAACEFASL